MTDMLRSVIDYGTGRGYKLANMPCAGKTGTTNDNKDGWFVGYTPYYCGAAWTGYDNAIEMSTAASNREQDISKKMLDDGLISVAEFNKLTAINRETFSPLFAEIMPEIP
jgi:membrane peptidoglycan carboxypeptidase